MHIQENTRLNELEFNDSESEVSIQDNLNTTLHLNENGESKHSDS